MFIEIPLLELVQEFGIQGCIQRLRDALLYIKLDARQLRNLIQTRGTIAPGS
ncbi:MAG: hypothetical protein KGZ92_07970 [Firmicutes bacterium]|nr:hypothetical protein [Dethiobacter sp.]MBS3889203.1 hypothetical protein [Bacillota bacterium]